MNELPMTVATFSRTTVVVILSNSPGFKTFFLKYDCIKVLIERRTIFLASRGVGKLVQLLISSHLSNFSVVVTLPFSLTSQKPLWSMLTKYWRLRTGLLRHFFDINYRIFGLISVIRWFNYHLFMRLNRVSSPFSGSFKVFSGSKMFVISRISAVWVVLYFGAEARMISPT